MINADSIAAMDDDAVIVNVARGHVIDREALIDALAQRQAEHGPGSTSSGRNRSIPTDTLFDYEVFVTPHASNACDVFVRETRGRRRRERAATDRGRAAALGGEGIVIVDVHTHLSTSEQWGPQFSRAIELTYPPDVLDINVTPERHWEAEQTADRVIVFGNQLDRHGDVHAQRPHRGLRAPAPGKDDWFYVN